MNPQFRTDPGNATNDKVFLLSIPEADSYFISDSARQCAPTAYATAHRAKMSDDYKTAEGKAACWWWLRSPGLFQNFASYVNYVGSVNYYGDLVLNDLGAIRPALWIDLNS